jgi:hypothetical protein
MATIEEIEKYGERIEAGLKDLQDRMEEMRVDNEKRISSMISHCEVQQLRLSRMKELVEEKKKMGEEMNKILDELDEGGSYEFKD